MGPTAIDRGGWRVQYEPIGSDVVTEDSETLKKAETRRPEARRPDAHLR
jgi:hypothetical protein